MIRQLSEVTEREVQEMLRWWRAIPKHLLGIVQGNTRHIPLDLYIFTLTEDMGETDPQEASADITTLEGNEFEESTVYDPLNIFSALVTGNTGYCHRQYGKWWALGGSSSTPSTDTYFGKLDGSIANGATDTMSIWADGADTGDDIEVTNRTTQTLSTGVLMRATRGVGATEYLVEPYELEECP